MWRRNRKYGVLGDQGRNHPAWGVVGERRRYSATKTKEHSKMALHLAVSSQLVSGLRKPLLMKVWESVAK